MHQLFEAAVCLCRQLEQHGYQAYLVGGCVRDILLGVQPTDYDIATNALPEQINQVFPTAQQNGAAFLVSRVRFMEHEYEIATFRKDQYPPEGSSRPASVMPVNSLAEDLMRRDFTINAIAMDVRGNLIDPLNGRDDLEKGILRETHAAAFSEDPIRILRGCKFIARFNVTPAPDTDRHMAENGWRLKLVAVERMRKELSAVLLGRYIRPAMMKWKSLQLLPYLLPRLQQLSDEEWITLIKLVEALPAEALLLKLAAICIFGWDVDEVTIRFSLSKREKKRLKFILSNYQMAFQIDAVKSGSQPGDENYSEDKSIHQWLAELGLSCWDEFLPLLRELAIFSYANARIQPFSNSDLLRLQAKKIAQIRRLRGNYPLGIFDLPFTGEEVVNRGFRGRAVGEVLHLAVRWMQKNGNVSWEQFWETL